MNNKQIKENEVFIYPPEDNKQSRARCPGLKLPETHESEVMVM